MTGGGVRESRGNHVGAGKGETGRRWLFGDVVFDEDTLELIVGGEAVEIEHKPLQVLSHLLRHAGEVVTKDEFAEHVWPGRVLSESVLSRAVSVLRSALHDQHRELIRTVHGFGYRLVAEIRTEAANREPAPVFDFKTGYSLPHRPHWRLNEKLGSGANGEAWLARHDKTGEQRVFKFALSPGALSSLKRELALSRVLREGLGEKAAVVRILDGNFDEAPYFIESEFVEGRDLEHWATTRGGLVRVSLSQRIEIAAQVADAVAAAHAIGVLHKDLKPGNVLVDESREGARVRIKLCDFGSGGILDPERVKTLGITGLGPAENQGGAVGTSLYLAPEIMLGQPVTVKADIYALGVMLYQLVVGDLRKPIAPGWEHEIEDDLLRQDITDASAGNTERRLADAKLLSERLSTLAVRRDRLTSERAAHEQQERAKRIVAELRRVRAYAAVLLALTGAAVAGAFYAHRASDRALAAAKSERAISDFLMNDVLRVDPTVERPADASYESLLNRAAAQVSARFKDDPEAAANAYWLLGRRYHEIGHIDSALAQYERAVPLMEQSYGRSAEPTMLVLDRLAHIYGDQGRMSEALAISQELIRNWTTLHGPSDPSTLLLRARSARIVIAAGDLAGGEHELRKILEEIPSADRANDDTKVHFEDWLEQNLATDISGLDTEASIRDALSARVRIDLGEYLAEYADEYRESVALLRKGLETYSKILDPQSDNILTTRISLAWVEGMAGNYVESDKLFASTLDAIDTHLPAAHPYRSIVKYALAYARLEAQRPQDAISLAKQAIGLCGQGCTARQKAEYLWILGCGYDQVGRSREAIASLSIALNAYERARGPDHVGTIKKRVALADALRKAGEPLRAKSVLAGIRNEGIGKLARDHPIIGEARRLQGLLALSERNLDQAISALEEATLILEQRLGSTHWRAKRVRNELAWAKSQRAQLTSS